MELFFGHRACVSAGLIASSELRLQSCTTCRVHVWFGIVRSTNVYKTDKCNDFLLFFFFSQRWSEKGPTENHSPSRLGCATPATRAEGFLQLIRSCWEEIHSQRRQDARRRDAPRMRTDLYHRYARREHHSTSLVEESGGINSGPTFSPKMKTKDLFSDCSI